MLLLDVRYDLPAMLFVKAEVSTEIHPPVWLLWTLDVHRDDQVVLRPQVDGKQVKSLNKGAIVDAVSCRRRRSDAARTTHVARCILRNVRYE